jgi:hypothetical protein
MHTNLILKAFWNIPVFVSLLEKGEGESHGGRRVQLSGILFWWQCALKIQSRAAFCGKGDKQRAAQTALESD